VKRQRHGLQTGRPEESPLNDSRPAAGTVRAQLRVATFQHSRERSMDRRANSAKRQPLLTGEQAMASGGPRNSGCAPIQKVRSNRPGTFRDCNRTIGNTALGGYDSPGARARRRRAKQLRISSTWIPRADRIPAHRGGNISAAPMDRRRAPGVQYTVTEVMFRLCAAARRRFRSDAGQ